MIDNIIYTICFFIIVFYIYRWYLLTKNNKLNYIENYEDNDNIEENENKNFTNIKYEGIRRSLISTDYKYKNAIYYDDVNDESFNYYKMN